MRLTDSHVHFWDPEVLQYRWLDEVPALRHRFGIHEFTEATEGFEVETIIFVQADCAADQGEAEVEWVKKLAAGEPRLRGVVAFAPIEVPGEAERAIARWKDEPLVRGVRRLLQSEGPGFCENSSFRNGVRLLVGTGLRFDLCCRAHQLPEVTQLVEACPGVGFVLDHFGKPDLCGGSVTRWKEDIRRLASAGDVVCKLSGLVTEADHVHWTREDLQPWVDAALDVFGTDRLLFGSDWPVCTLASSYQRWVKAALHCFSGLGVKDRDAIFRSNALQVYGIKADTEGKRST
jgi:L-fuconolactonase